MNTETLLILIVAGLAASIAISYFLFRWIFSVKRQLWNQQQIITLLLLLVEKEKGVTDTTATIRDLNNRADVG